METIGRLMMMLLLGVTNVTTGAVEVDLVLVCYSCREVWESYPT